jgi:hypothetical protein
MVEATRRLLGLIARMVEEQGVMFARELHLGRRAFKDIGRTFPDPQIWERMFFFVLEHFIQL